jgi:peptidoglycan/LPS O-acetylase OafA/YrhL
VKHIKSLDGLRGIAVLCVVLFHFFPREGAGALTPFVSSGWAGVDLFFVLSGYLITRELYAYRTSENFCRVFYAKRVLRLLPLYYFIFLVGAALTPLLGIQWKIGHVAILFHGANLVLPRDNSLGTLGPFSIFHLWSLALEEQFYLIWPLIVVSKLSRETLRRICIGAMITAPLVRLSMLHNSANPSWLYQSLPTRMDALLAGALLSLIPLPSLNMARMTGAVALLGFSWLAWRGHSFFFLSRPIQGLGYSAVALLCASVLVMCLHAGTITEHVCSWRVLRFFGRYSYGLYLWHYLFLRQFEMLTAFVQRHVTMPFVAAVVSFGLILLCSTAIAFVSYRLIEQPFLRLKKRFQYGPVGVQQGGREMVKSSHYPALQTGD